MRQKRSPQEKKQLSYQKDRRNWYGENNKSSRSSIRLRKRLINRQMRRHVTLRLQPGTFDGEQSDIRVLDVQKLLKRTRWRKSPDTKLLLVVKYKIERRLRRFSPDIAS